MRPMNPAHGNAGANGVMTANRLYMIPLVVWADMALIELQIRVTTGAAGNARLGIYNDKDGLPATLRLDAGTVDTTLVGHKTIAISHTLTAGSYWLALVFNAAPTCRVAAIVDPAMLGYSTADDGIMLLHRPYTFAALPADESASIWMPGSAAIVAPIVFMETKSCVTSTMDPTA